MCVFGCWCCPMSCWVNLGQNPYQVFWNNVEGDQNLHHSVTPNSMATKTTFSHHYHWQSKLFQSSIILVATQQLTTKLWWNMAHYGMASMYFWVTFHILWQKNWENSINFLVSSVNSTEFPIFWLYFGIWHQKNMKNKNNECKIICSIIWCLQPFIKAFCVLTWTHGSSNMLKISTRK
jgi:hypothetical protein